MPDFFDPTPETQNVVFIDAATLRKAEKLIIGCEGCSPDDAELPFDNVLDRVTGNDPAVTDYIFVEAMAKCRSGARHNVANSLNSSLKARSLMKHMRSGIARQAPRNCRSA